MRSLPSISRAVGYPYPMGIFEDILRVLTGKDRAVAAAATADTAKRNAVADVVLPLEGHDLDEQQLACIASDAHTQLVLAGAGAGKTTTIVGLVKYLLATVQYKPYEILALSYTHASACELSERLRRETKQDVEASTFHKLGLEIMTEVEGKKPSISNASVRRFVLDELDRRMQDPSYSARLGIYLHNRKNARQYDQREQMGEEEYHEQLRANPPETMRGERVKSLGEVTIANFLFCKGIEYEYERAYEYDTATEKYAQYHPDFYLPNSGTYIEFLALNERGEAPSWFEGRDGKSGTQTYLDSYAWKMKLHKEKGTDCIYLFAYQESNDTLVSELSKQLDERGIKMAPVSSEVIWDTLSRDRDEALESVASLFATLISLLKSTGTTVSELERRCPSKRTRFTLSLLKPVYEAYQSMLSRTGAIDFDDMINQARTYVEQGRYRHHYRFVIIDEYQDISASRHGLVKALRDQTDFRLFCVGDDWQSIYQFSGSDVGFIIHFERWWGRGVVSRIETTRRFSRSLIDVSSGFVMANPNQMAKSLVSASDSESFDVEEITGYTAAWAFEFAVQRMEELPEKASVLLMGRYGFDERLIVENARCRLQWDQEHSVQRVRLAKRPDLDVVFRTVHASKGLEADYVFILNNSSETLGFPSQIEDDPIVDLLLRSSDGYPDAEERRLFYVALTRARKKVFLLTAEGKASRFVEELRQRWGDQLKEGRFVCPLCGGELVVKNGKYGKFWGCRNFRTTRCEFTRDIPTKESVSDDRGWSGS